MGISISYALQSQHMAYIDEGIHGLDNNYSIYNYI
jgi:hypothetical protein